jgi:hypothetical protein
MNKFNLRHSAPAITSKKVAGKEEEEEEGGSDYLIFLSHKKEGGGDGMQNMCRIVWVVPLLCLRIDWRTRG